MTPTRDWRVVLEAILRALWVLRRWPGVAIMSLRPVLNDFNRRGWFSEDRADLAALEVAGSEALTLTRRRRGICLFGRVFGNDDVAVMPNGQRPMFEHVVRFWEKVGLPVSPHVFWGRATGFIPKGFRLLLGAYDKVYDQDGNYRRWRRILEVTRSRSDFVAYCKAHGFGHLLPRTDRYEAGQAPNAAMIAEYFTISDIWWIKLDEEVLNQHPVIRCTTVEEMLAAIQSMAGGAFIVQQNVAGVSYSLSYEAVRTWYGRWKAVHCYTAVEMVRGSSQLGAHAHPEHEVVRKYTDKLAQHLVRKGLRHMLGFGVIYDVKTGVGFINDNNLRQQGGHPVWQFFIKAIMAGMPVKGLGSLWEIIRGIFDGKPSDGMTFYYEYLDLDVNVLAERVGMVPDDIGDLAGEVLLKAILDDPDLCPNIREGTGIYPVGINPDGSGKYAGYGENAFATVELAKERLGLHLRH